ncbi:hypothetical protein XHC_0287 [Xanthomonas hortorum pv. carotae str. M081]|nr:hypothetical protein XHC_0287 [Xanthomonas hortorum pv. carotae str. M081]
MRLKLFSSSRSQIAPEPLSPASTTTTKNLETTTQHLLSQGHKRSKPQGTAKTSTQALLASARKSFESLRKQLPSMHMNSSALRPTRTSAAPRPYVTQVATPARPPQRHGAQPVVDAHRQQPAPQATGPARVKGPEPQRTAPIPRPAPIRQAPIPIVSPPLATSPVMPGPGHVQQAQQRQPRTEHGLQGPISNARHRETPQQPKPRHNAGSARSVPPAVEPASSTVASPRAHMERQPSLRRLTQDFAEINKRYNEISKQLFVEDRDATPAEEQVIEQRYALLAKRNEVRDSELNALLAALAPMQDISAPHATTGAIPQCAREHNQRELKSLEKELQFVDQEVLKKYYTRAARRLDSLEESGAPPAKMRQLKRMMQGYQNMLALKEAGKVQLASSNNVRPDKRQHPQHTVPTPQLVPVAPTLSQGRVPQLETLLAALAPVEDIPAPKPITLPFNSANSWVKDNAVAVNFNSAKLWEFINKNIDGDMLKKNYALAERYLESLEEGAMPSPGIARLRRMMQGYKNLVSLKNITEQTDNHLHKIGAPRQMSLMPTTAQERKRSYDIERNDHQEAIDNGYL